MLEAVRLQRSKDFDELLERTADLEHDNVQHKERAKTYRESLQALEDDLHKARNEKSVNERALEKEVDKLRMKVEEQEMAIEGLKDELDEEKKKQQKALEEKDQELQEVKAELAESLESVLNIQGTGPAGTGSKGKGSTDGTINLTKSMAVIPRDRLKELEGHQARLTTMKATNEKMAKDLKERTDAVKDLTDQLAVNGDELQKKLLENKRLREELEVRITQESKEFKKLGKAKKIVNDMKLDADEKNRIIKQLRQQIEVLEAKLLKMAKVFDKQRNSASKIDQSMRLNQLYATKLQGTRALSPTFNQERPTSVREFSPRPISYPTAPASDSKARRLASADRFDRTTDGDAEFLSKDLNTADLGPVAPDIHDRVLTYCFLKANSPDYLSPYLFRDDSKLMVAGQMKSTGKYERTGNGGFINQRPYHFKRLFTQYELEAMSRDLAACYSGDRILSVVYGSPLNIKLFVILKMILAFFARVSASVRDGGIFDLEFILQSRFAKAMTDHLESLPSVERDRDFTSKVYGEGEDLILIHLYASMPLMLEHCKKFFYDILTQSTAPGFFLVSVEVQFQQTGSRSSRENSSPTQRLTIVRSQVQSLSSHLTYKECLSGVVANCGDQSSARFASLESQRSTSKLFFLVLEPGKVSSYEESLSLLDVHSQLDKHRVQPKSYSDRSVAKRSGSSQVNRAAQETGGFSVV